MREDATATSKATARRIAGFTLTIVGCAARPIASALYVFSRFQTPAYTATE